MASKKVSSVGVWTHDLSVKSHLSYHYRPRVSSPSLIIRKTDVIEIRYLVMAILFDEVSKPPMKKRRAFEMRNDSTSSALNTFCGSFASIAASASNWLSNLVSFPVFWKQLNFTLLWPIYLNSSFLQSGNIPSLLAIESIEIDKLI